jgi:hypothetical protein
MDAASYEDLRGRLFSLLIAVEDRLGREQARWVHHVIDVDEYGLALEDMVDILAQAKAPVTDQERADMLDLARRMQMDDLAPRQCAAGAGPVRKLKRYTPPEPPTASPSELSHSATLTLPSTRIWARVSKVAISQIRTTPSSPPDASQLPSGAMATAVTGPSWPTRVVCCCPAATSQIRTIPSRPPEASQLPSGATATASM